MKKPKIFISGPLFSSGNIFVNIKRAVMAGHMLKQAGAIPFIPHLYAFWAIMQGLDESYGWMEMDLAWLECCDAVLRLEGDSKGADEEVDHALSLGLTVFSKYNEYSYILAWISKFGTAQETEDEEWKALQLTQND